VARKYPPKEKPASTVAIEEHSKAHQVYKNAAGDIVPGVTSILDEFDSKGNLVRWSNKQGLRGIDSGEYARNSAEIGTRAHDLIHSYLNPDHIVSSSPLPPGLEPFATAAFACFSHWFASSNVVNIIATEQQLHGEEYGGTMDAVLSIGGTVTLVDWKTGNSVRPYVHAQLEAYARLWDATHETKIESLLALQLDKDGGPATPHPFNRSDLVFDYFEDLRRAYLKKERLGW
jgi:hypothetical protein